MRCYTFKFFLLFAAFLSNFGIANAMFKKSFTSTPVTLSRQDRIRIKMEKGRVGQETKSINHDMSSPPDVTAEETFNNPNGRKTVSVQASTSSTLKRKSPSSTTPIMATDDSETDNTELYGDCPKARAMLPLSAADLPPMPFLPVSLGTPDLESLKAFLRALRDDQWDAETSVDSTPDSDFRPLPVSVDPEISNFSEDEDINI